MGLQNLVKFGAMGLATDIFAGPMTGGQGVRLGAIAGLFAPDAQDMDNVYQGSNFSGLPMEFLGFPMMDGLFGNTQGGPRDPAPVKNEWPGWAKALAVAAGAMLMGANGGSFSFPLYTFAAGLTPYNSGGAIPLAWSSGLISNWGWSRGFIM